MLETSGMVNIAPVPSRSPSPEFCVPGPLGAAPSLNYSSFLGSSDQILTSDQNGDQGALPSQNNVDFTWHLRNRYRGVYTHSMGVAACTSLKQVLCAPHPLLSEAPSWHEDAEPSPSFQPHLLPSRRTVAPKPRTLALRNQNSRC